MACLGALIVNSLCILRPFLYGDDFQIVVASWTWQDVRSNLWVPQNEHSMPLGRISTYVLARLAGKQTNVPLVLALQGPLALIAAAVLVYLLVQRETGQPFPALLAMMLFGINSHYEQAVNWFAASFVVLGLDTLLLGLLAAQRWRQTGRPAYLALSALWCLMAPGWFGSGVLAGPLCALYLLVSPRPVRKGERPFSWRPLNGATLRQAVRRILVPALVPLLGTIISLAITLPLNGKQIANLPRVEQPGTPAWKTFAPLTGLEYSLRAMVDDMIPGAMGLKTGAHAIPTVAVVWLFFLAFGVLWWLLSSHRPLLILGLGFILLSDEAIFTVRAYFPYEDIHSASRYQLFAHLGLVLFICGGLPRPFIKAVNTTPLRLLDLAAVVLLGFLLWTQWPQAGESAGTPPQSAAQYGDLDRVQKMDERCDEHHIDRTTARQALPEWAVYGTGRREWYGRLISGWDLLRGSREPQAMTIDEARELLKEE
jgi:hypothetical protein